MRALLHRLTDQSTIRKMTRLSHEYSRNNLKAPMQTPKRAAARPRVWHDAELIVTCVAKGSAEGGTSVAVDDR